MMNEPISSIMIKNVVTLEPTDTILKAKEQFFEHGFHHIPIIKDGDLVGVVTKSDLWKTGQTFDKYNEILIEEVMTKKMVHLSPNQRIGVAAELFLENKFSYIPIVDGTKLKGIISSQDIMLYNFKKEYPRQFD